MGFGGFCPLPIRLGGALLEGWTPEAHARACADLLAVLQTAPLARIWGTTGTTEITAYAGMHGVGPEQAPTVTTGGAGFATVTWDVSYTDEFGAQYPIRIRQARVTLFSPGLEAARSATCRITASNVVEVQTWTDAGALSSAGFHLTVW